MPRLFEHCKGVIFFLHIFEIQVEKKTKRQHLCDNVTGRKKKKKKTPRNFNEHNNVSI